MLLVADMSDMAKAKRTRVFVASWVLARIRDAYRPSLNPEMFEVLGFLNAKGEMAGGVIYHDFTGHDIHVSAAGEGSWLTPMGVRAIFEYPFTTLGVKRMTATISKPNDKSRKFVQRLGFKLEGNMRRGFPDGKDKMLYGMLKSECRWLKETEQ